MRNAHISEMRSKGLMFKSSTLVQICDFSFLCYIYLLIISFGQNGIANGGTVMEANLTPLHIMSSNSLVNF